ncbi:helix-turn-helix domain-containing protein [Streptomyces sp. NPDC047725]|uniref:helix-turn-helix domain-containing protein n=1 Tax=Streptomyces sp. NPDC047725 TaxID=3365487 RepID=UPI00371E4815
MEPPDTEDFDQALRVQLKQVEQAARTILESLTAADGAVSEPLQQMVRLQVLAEKLTPHMVARTKLRGATWDQIGVLLGMTRDTARKKFNLPARRSGQRSVPVVLPPTLAGPAAAGPAPAADAAVPTAPDGADAGGDGTGSHSPPTPAPAPVPCPLPATGGRDLATVLSSLQRASGLSLRALAGRTSLSPSFLSRVMSGERFPSWKHACSTARACGADPEVLRRIWESSNARRDNQPRPSTLASALRFLHLRAGNPTPWAIPVRRSLLEPSESGGRVLGHQAD